MCTFTAIRQWRQGTLWGKGLTKTNVKCYRCTDVAAEAQREKRPGQDTKPSEGVPRSERGMAEKREEIPKKEEEDWKEERWSLLE